MAPCTSSVSQRETVGEAGDVRGEDRRQLKDFEPQQLPAECGPKDTRIGAYRVNGEPLRLIIEELLSGKCPARGAKYNWMLQKCLR